MSQPDRAFDDPPSFEHAEPFDLRIFGDDFDVDAERGAVFDSFDLEPGIDPGLGQSRVDRGGLVE